MLLEIMELKEEVAAARELTTYAPSGWNAAAARSDARPDAQVDEARFCEWALQKLGHVALFAFGGLEASPFMVVAENGERTRGATLALALQEMIECQGNGVRKPLYQPALDGPDLAA